MFIAIIYCYSNLQPDQSIADVKKTLELLSIQNPLIRGPHLAKIEFYKHFYLEAGKYIFVC